MIMKTDVSFAALIWMYGCMDVGTENMLSWDLLLLLVTNMLWIFGSL